MIGEDSGKKRLRLSKTLIRVRMCSIFSVKQEVPAERPNAPPTAGRQVLRSGEGRGAAGAREGLREEGRETWS